MGHSNITIVAHTAPSDFPGGEEGTELTVEFSVLGQKFVGLLWRSNFTPNEAVSFTVRDVFECDLLVGHWTSRLCARH